MKYLIFDAGPLISLAMSGMIRVIEDLKKDFDGEFVITPHVKKEVIDRPMKIKKYKLEAIQVKNLLDKGILKMTNEFVSDQKLNAETKKILKLASGFLRTESDGKKIKIIHDGEAACLAFAKLCSKCESLIVIDERSTRLLTESPDNLHLLMERKLHTNLVSEKSLLEEFKRFKFIRSPELLFIAYKKDILHMKKDKQLLDALLYAVKFKGAAISSAEIESMKKLV